VNANDDYLVFIHGGAFMFGDGRETRRRNTAVNPPSPRLLSRLPAANNNRWCAHAGSALPNGSGWVVLADPEGNKFCIPPNDAARAAR